MYETGPGPRGVRGVPLNLVAAGVVALVTFGAVQLALGSRGAAPTSAVVPVTAPGPTAATSRSGPPTSAAPTQSSAGPSTTPAAVPDLPDGTLVSAAGTPRVFVLAGGAPLFVGRKSDKNRDLTVVLAPDAFARLPRRPADGTLVVAGSQHYVFAGGAPLAVTAPKAVGATQKPVAVSAPALNRAGGAAPWDRADQYPANGTVLRAGPKGAYFVVEGGVARPTTTTKGAVVVDPQTLSRAGKGLPWSHLKPG